MEVQFAYELDLLFLLLLKGLWSFNILIHNEIRTLIHNGLLANILLRIGVLKRMQILVWNRGQKHLLSVSLLPKKTICNKKNRKDRLSNQSFHSILPYSIKAPFNRITISRTWRTDFNFIKYRSKNSVKGCG
jgi:hypothetical protein